MALQAGEISIKISTDTDEIKKLRTELDSLKGATDKSKDSMKGMAGEFVKGQIIFEAIKKGLELVVNYTKESIKAFNESERAQLKLRQVISGNADAYIDFANEIQNTLNIEEEQVMATITLAKNMGVAENKLKDVTKTAIGLSKAFGVDLDMATRLAVNATQGNTEALQRYIPTLKTATTEAQRQAIIQQAVANGFKIAGAEANTFEGQMKALEIQQGEIQEGFGKIVTTLAKEYTPAFVNAAKATAEWMNNSKTQNTIIISLKPVLETIAGIVTQFTNGLKELFSSFKMGNKDIDVFAIAMKTVATILTVTFTFIKANVQAFITLITPIKLAAKAISNLWVLLTGSKQEKEQAKKNIESIKDDLLKIPMDFVKLAEESTQKIKKLWTTTAEETKKAQEEISSNGGAIGTKMGVGRRSASTASQAMPMFNPEGFAKGFDISTITKKVTENVKFAANEALKGMNDIVKVANEAFQQQQSNRLALLEEGHDRELNAIQSRLDKELEMIEYNGLTKEQFLMQNVQKARAANDEEAMSAAQRELDIYRAVKKGNDEKTKADQDYQKKKYQIELEAFKSNQANSIVAALISGALATAGAWASVGNIPFPGNVIAGVALSALITGITAAQIGIIASQKPPRPPAFATGGIVPGPRGVGDQTTAKLSGGEMVLNEGQQKNLLAMATNGGAGGMVANFYLDGEAVPVKNVFLKNRKNEAYRQ